MTTTKPTFNMSADTRFFFQELQKLNSGTTITYDELTDLIGWTNKKVSSTTPALQSARRALLSRQIVIDSVRLVGVRRLNDSEKIASAQKEIVGIRSKSRQGAKKLISVDNYATLSNHDQLAHTTQMTVFAFTRDLASAKGMKKVQAACQMAGVTELSLKDTAAALLRAGVK
jgi:hypothetical protein